MKNGKFLSDVLDTSCFRYGALNLITAPCGCGKTTASINKIAPLASCPRKALYLIDTKNGNERLAKNPALTMPYHFYEESIANRYFCADELEPDKVVITTYAQFGVWAKHNPDFAAFFEVILCDEIHNLVIFPTFHKDKTQPNYAEIARNAIINAVWGGKTLIVGMTATPEPLSRLSCPQNSISIDTASLRQYENKTIIRYSGIRQVLERLPPNQKGAVYVARIEQMKEIEALARQAGRKPICVWSTANEAHPMTEEQLAARAYILEHEEVPPQYDLFLFNASCETAINLYGSLSFFILHTSKETSITQARGRYRGDLETLYLYDPEEGEIWVPEAFLDVRLFTKDKEILRGRLGIRLPSSKGKPISYEKLFDRLQKCGYTIQNGREKNLRFIVIGKIEKQKSSNSIFNNSVDS